MPAFGIATYNLLDTRLMMAWAHAFAERNDMFSTVPSKSSAVKDLDKRVAPIF